MWRCAKGPGSRIRGQKGQAIIEMVIVLPLLLLLLFGIVEMALGFRAYHVVTNSSREGARRAVVVGATTDQVEQAVSERLAAGGLDPAQATIEITCQETGSSGVCNGPDEVGQSDQVRVEYPFTFQLIWPLAKAVCSGCGGEARTVTLIGQTVMRHE